MQIKVVIRKISQRQKQSHPTKHLRWNCLQKKKKNAQGSE